MQNSCDFGIIPWMATADLSSVYPTHHLCSTSLSSYNYAQHDHQQIHIHENGQVAFSVARPWKAPQLTSRTSFTNGVDPYSNSIPVTNSRSQSMGSLPVTHSNLYGLCDVWHNNLRDGIALLRCLALVYKYVAVDTEFPGVITKANQDYTDASEQAYQNIRENLKVLKPIQIGFSFMNEGGLTQMDHCTTVQFNMRWDVHGDQHSVESIRLLENSGIDFLRLKTEGVLAEDFAAALIGSGAVLNKDLRHIGYHSAYDWAYLLKVLTGWVDLPSSYSEYKDMLSLYFPTVLDVKVFQMNLTNAPKGGLQELADSFAISRFGAQHQAGSDARLTGEVFFRILEDFRLPARHDFSNLIYGLNYGQGSHLWVPKKHANHRKDLRTPYIDSSPPQESPSDSELSCCSCSSAGASDVLPLELVVGVVESIECDKGIILFNRSRSSSCCYSANNTLL